MKNNTAYIIDTNKDISKEELAQICELFNIGAIPRQGDVIHTTNSTYIVEHLIFDLPKRTIKLSL